MPLIAQTSKALPLVNCALLIAFSSVVSLGDVIAKPLEKYQSIIDRNAFGLKDPPPAEVEKPKAPPFSEAKTDFYLTGITSIGYPKKPKKAYLLNKDATKKNFDERFVTLTVGGRSGDLVLNEIDEKGRRVRIAYRGEEKWLSMHDNGVPPPLGPSMNQTSVASSSQTNMSSALPASLFNGQLPSVSTASAANPVSNALSPILSSRRIPRSVPRTR